MKHANWLVVMTLVALSGMAAAQLIGSTRVVAQVPFEFMVANKIVPAGECVVQAITMDGKTLMIRNAEARVGLLSRSSQSEGKQGASHYALLFKHYGNRYFLSGIKLQGSNITYRLPESKVQAELRAQSMAATDETLRASLK